MDDDLEAQLVERARRGDPSAAPFLVSCYGERLLGYARSHAPDLTDTDRECIVELAIEAGVRAIERFDPKLGTLQSWFRGQIRFKTMAWRRARPPSLPLGVDLADEPQPDRSVDTSTTGALRRAIARLSRDDQLILALRSVEQLAFSEIAQRLGIEAATARQRHHRARNRLREQAEADETLQTYMKEVPNE